MAASNLLLLLGAVGLATGCVAGGPSARDAERPPIYSPAPTRAGAPKVPADRMPESPPNAAIPRAPSPAPHRPPAVIELGSPRTSVEMARADLAHRLDADVALIEVAEASFGRTTDQDRQCVAEGSLEHRLLTRGGDVQHIHLLLKGRLYRYLGLGELAIYCPDASTSQH
jgi:hypothetical protein